MLSEQCIEKLALAGAKKICGQGKCTCSYPCGHTNREDLGVPMVGSSKVCPLACYNVAPVEDSRPWYKIPAAEITSTQQERFALCCKCSNATRKTDASGMYVQRKDLTLCCDCPVKAVEDEINETICES